MKCINHPEKDVVGAERMAKLLCLRHSDGLEDVFEAILPVDRNQIDIDINESLEKRLKETQGTVKRKFANKRVVAN
ncbi:MAG TPA: hypothetical protein VFD00_05940 [Thermoclostridium sp.]|nr:hypothetical protein [Thermoclostridium sp.]